MGRRSSPDSSPSPDERLLCGWIPARNVTTAKSWQGVIPKKPWDYRVTAMLPHLDTPELLEPCIQLLQMQTERPYIVVVDTGSSPKNAGILEELESKYDDVEVHRLRFKAVIHPSDPVAIAMDLAFSLCATPYAYTTHVDCFLRRRDWLEYVLDQMRKDNVPVAGYQITERPPIDTSKWVGHTSTFFNMKFWDEQGLGWSQRRLCNLTGWDHQGDNRTNGYPDTEFLLNWQLDRLDEEQDKTHRVLLGEEENFETTLDGNIHHVRSYASSILYSPEHLAKSAPDMQLALQQVYKRLAKWRTDDAG